MGTLDDLLDRLPRRLLIGLSGLAVAIMWSVQKVLMLRSGALMQAAVTADVQSASRLLAESSLQRSLNTVSLVCSLVALPGLLTAWRSLVRNRPKSSAILLLLMIIAWPTLAATELAFHFVSAGAFPLHDLVVGAPFVTAVVASLSLGTLRPRRRSLDPWSLAAWSLAIAFFVIPRLLSVYPRSDASWPRVASAGGLVLLAVVVGSGVLLALQGATLPSGSGEPTEPKSPP